MTSQASVPPMQRLFNLLMVDYCNAVVLILRTVVTESWLCI